MRLFVVEARNFDINTSLFLMLEASTPEDARKRAEAYYEQEKWSPAAIHEVQPVAQPRYGVTLLYRQRWDALQVGTLEPEQAPAQRTSARETVRQPTAHEEAVATSLVAPREASLLMETSTSGEDGESHPSQEDVLGT